MRVLRHDAFARRRVRAHATGIRHGVLALLMLVSVGLLFLSRLQHSQITEIRLQLAELMAPALHAALLPFEPLRRMGQRAGETFEMFSELDRLRAENQRLRDWEWRAQEAERRATLLGRLANVAEEAGIEFRTARVVAHSSGPFVRSAMLGLGRANGMKAGYPVIDAGGFVGRLVETGAKAARVLLVTDINSRIPVFVGKAAVRAVLQGDNGPSPRLGHLPPEATIAVGDEVFTSGVGGMLPRGLRVGTVIEEAGSYRMQPHARLDELDYVSIMMFDNPATEIGEEEPVVRSREVIQRRSALERRGAEKVVVSP